MRSRVVVRLIASIAILSLCACSRRPAAVERQASPLRTTPTAQAAPVEAVPPEPAAVRPGVAVVELFTSEGCSSCPPADSNLAALAQRGRARVFALSFHVDYWNDLGWRDPYSSSAFSARQREYATLFARGGRRRVYTPQIVVNGDQEFVGSKRGALSSAVDDALAQAARSRVEVALTGPNRAGTVAVRFSVRPAHPRWSVRVALVQRSGAQSVARGENAGRKLTHVNIVREFATFPAGIEPRTWRVQAPRGVEKQSLAVIAFVQNTDSGRIVAANGT